MALPSSGIITAAMINTELGRAANAPFNLNDAAVRALAAKPSGAISFSDFYGKASEIVKTVTASRVNLCLQDLFTPAEWVANTPKRVVINAGVEIGDTSSNWALVQAWDATGVAGSWVNSLTLENRGVISGRPGPANSGVGGTALRVIFGGRSGQKLLVNNLGTIRGGGGGGGRGGNGGTGGGGQYASNVRDPASGERYDGSNMWRYAIGWSWTSIIVNGAQITVWPVTATSLASGGYTYYRGALRNTWYDEDGAQYNDYAWYRTSSSTVNTNGGGGGAGGNGGVGQGYGQLAAAGANGAGGAAGGANAGAGGTGGKGGNGGGWGAAGAAGATGNTGAAGNRTGGAAGAGGAAGGAAGCYVDGNSNVTFVAAGTRQGRAIN